VKYVIDTNAILQAKEPFSHVWVDGSTNHQTSNMIDHVTSCQHSVAMNYFKIGQAKDNDDPLTSVAPILRALMKLDSLSRERLKRKFNLCFTMAGSHL